MFNEGVQNTLVGQLPRSTDVQLFGSHQPEHISELQGYLYIVRRQEDGLLFFMCQAPQQLEQFYLAGIIEEGGRFIQDSMPTSWMDSSTTLRSSFDNIPQKPV